MHLSYSYSACNMYVTTNTVFVRTITLWVRVHAYLIPLYKMVHEYYFLQLQEATCLKPIRGKAIKAQAKRKTRSDQAQGS